MIEVTDLHEKLKYVNAEMVEMIESTPDTQIVLNNGHRVYVKEEPGEISDRIIAYRRKCLQPKIMSISGES